jgi:predicted FMN-binding regulatory protein PaiB
MYTPRHNLEEDTAKLYAFMKAHSFATLVTVQDACGSSRSLAIFLESLENLNRFRQAVIQNDFQHARASGFR